MFSELGLRQCDPGADDDYFVALFFHPQSRRFYGYQGAPMRGPCD
jgi:hypothetical protein